MKKYSLKNDPQRKREKRRYANPIPSREYIVQVMEEVGKPLSREQLVKTFSLNLEAADVLRHRLLAMHRGGQVMCDRRGNYALVKQIDLVRGTVIGHKDGFGFVELDQGGDDVFLPTSQMRAVFHGDRVLVKMHAKRGNRKEGVVVEILERNTKQIVGRYFEESGCAFVVSTNKNISQDVVIPARKNKGAKSGQLVVVEIVSYPSKRRQAVGHVIEILGDHMAPGMEIEVALRAHEIPHVWSKKVLTEVRKYKPKVTQRDLTGRQDLRKLAFVTIDGDDAKDFDDAVYCEKRAKGGWRLYVAIADVSYYVTPASELDKEALNRGNSVYFPGFVVPMLPEVLSNELCSLKPQVDRLAMVCDMAISAEGKIERYRFYPAAICSRARLTYTVVAAMLEDKTKRNAGLLKYLQELHNLYKVFLAGRHKRGAIEFESIETRIIFDAERKIKEIVPVHRNDAHKIIEECMLAVNVCAANFLLSKELSALYRVHEPPKLEKLEALRLFLRGVNLQLTGGEHPTPQDYARLVQKTKGRPDEHLVQTVMLRSLQQAVYSHKNVGHFGLAYDAYAHFTSPIRRYPDLLVHRAIRRAVSHKAKAEDSGNMAHLGEHCSMTERRADDATRDVVDWLKCEYMQEKVGEVFDGVISGVTNFGVFVELQNVYVEGLLHITQLTEDYYEYDDVHHYLRGKRRKEVYRLGDAIKVRVDRVDLDERKIDFGLV